MARKASAHVVRDRKRGYPCDVSGYKQTIHAPVLRSGGRDAYTHELLDWSLISTYENEASRVGRHAYKASLALLPTVDHHAPGAANADFRICAWRTNDAKNDLPIEAFVALCKRVVAQAETAERNSEAAQPANVPMTTSPPDIDAIIEHLARHRQRATYGALAGLVGGVARSVMGRHPRTPRNSWVVSVLPVLSMDAGEAYEESEASGFSERSLSSACTAPGRRAAIARTIRQGQDRHDRALR